MDPASRAMLPNTKMVDSYLTVQQLGPIPVGLVIGIIGAALTLLLGNRILALFNLFPLAILGVLLLFAGSQLALTVLDIRKRKEIFVVVVILGITLASNLAAGFISGIAAAYRLRSEKLTV